MQIISLLYLKSPIYSAYVLLLIIFWLLCSKKPKSSIFVWAHISHTVLLVCCFHKCLSIFTQLFQFLDTMLVYLIICFIGHVKFILVVVQLVVIDYLFQKLLACFYMQKMKICFVTLGHRDVWGLRRIRHLECWLHCYWVAHLCSAILRSPAYACTFPDCSGFPWFLFSSFIIVKNLDGLFILSVCAMS